MKAARAEHGDETAEAMSLERSAPPVPADPGAVILVDALVAAMGPGVGGAPTRVALRGMRNQSRTTTREFDAFVRRLAELLSEAGRTRSVVFDAAPFDDDAAASFDLSGSAYVINAGGFDQWELYLTLRLAGEPWNCWEGGAPVRVLRQPRPGAQQVFVPPSLSAGR